MLNGALLGQLEGLWDTHLRSAFSQTRVFERAKALSIGLLRCKDRRTISNLLVELERQYVNWSADYRTFSQSNWDVRELFKVTKISGLKWIPEAQPIVVSMDDTKLHKTGTKIPGVSYQRDPLSPPFSTNFIRAQRFLQLSHSVPLSTVASSAVRAFPIAFEHVPPPQKPKRSATEEEKKRYRELQRTQNLSWAGVRLIQATRNDYDELGQKGRKLIVTVDGSYTNQTVLKNLPADTEIIGRIRKDTKFFYRPEQQPGRGRKRWYGERAPTPEELRQDEQVPWEAVEAHAAGQTRTFQVKTISSLLWKKAGYERSVRLIVIKPVGYRKTKEGKLNYRQPAYLICTDESINLENIVQWYVWRWDIELNNRDEKQLIGVGEAQVWSEKAAERVPAFAVASYSMLLVAAALTYGVDAKAPNIEQPKWRRDSVAKQVRLTTGQLLEELRTTPLILQRMNFEHFVKKQKTARSYRN